jgi:hypothetical protein
MKPTALEANVEEANFAASNSCQGMLFKYLVSMVLRAA